MEEKTFKMRINAEDEKNINELAARLGRTKSGAMKFMAKTWVEVLRTNEKPENLRGENTK